MNTHHDKVIDMVMTSDALFKKVAKEIDMTTSCIYSMCNQHQYSDTASPVDLGYDEEESEEVFYRVNSLHDNAGITILGLGCYRIVFSLGQHAVKVDLPHCRNNSNSENKEDYRIWKKIKNTASKYLVTPILHSFCHKEIGRVNFFPIVDKMNYYTWEEYERFDNDEGEDLLDHVNSFDINDEEKLKLICYLVANYGFDDNHEGNWGFYEGRPVIIDFASFYPQFKGNSKVMRYIVSKIRA